MEDSSGVGGDIRSVPRDLGRFRLSRRDVPEGVVALTCPWCEKSISLGQDTARVNQFLWHAGCAEDFEMTRYEEATS